MLKVKTIAIAVGVLLMVFSTVLLSQAGVVGSKHDFSITGTSGFSGYFTGDNDEPCVYCHTPHAALGQQTPLWNKQLNTTATYIMYSSATMDATVPSTPSTYSLLCLSCHDGVSAINAVLNSPGHGSPGITGGPPNNFVDLGGPAKWVNIGDTTSATSPIDLSNDHPISVDYTQAVNGGGFYTTPQDPRLKLYNNKVECPTCHDPHRGTPWPGEGISFMRMPNTGSNMCLSCHIK